MGSGHVNNSKDSLLLALSGSRDDSEDGEKKASMKTFSEIAETSETHVRGDGLHFDPAYFKAKKEVTLPGQQQKPSFSTHLFDVSRQKYFLVPQFIAHINHQLGGI